MKIRKGVRLIVKRVELWSRWKGEDECAAAGTREEFFSLVIAGALGEEIYYLINPTNGTHGEIIGAELLHNLDAELPHNLTEPEGTPNA